MINPIRRTPPTNTWTTEDIRLLRRLAIEGAPLETIAVTLRRTHSAIRNKATMHGISLRRCGSAMSSNQAASA